MARSRRLEIRLELIVTVIGAIGTSTQPELKQATDEEGVRILTHSMRFPSQQQ